MKICCYILFKKNILVTGGRQKNINAMARQHIYVNTESFEVIWCFLSFFKSLLHNLTEGTVNTEKCSRAENTGPCKVTLRLQRTKGLKQGSGVSEIKQGTIKLRQDLMALEAILQLALVQSAAVRRSISIITGQTSPSRMQNAWRGWKK